MSIKSICGVMACGLIAMLVGRAGAQAFDPAVSFQGRLEFGGTPADGTYEMIFEVFNTQEGGFFQAAAGSGGAPLLVEVEDGLFTAELDFQPESVAYSGVERWVEIRVRQPGETFFTLLSPRQRLSPAPYANRAGSALVADVADVAHVAEMANDIPDQWKAFSVVPGVGPVYAGVGRVGIGTQTPEHKLQVQGTLNVNAVGPNTGLIIGTPNITDGGGTAMVLGVNGPISEIQGIASAGERYGDLYLNRQGGDVALGGLGAFGWFCTVNDPGGRDVIFGVRKDDGGAAFRVYADGDLSGCGITCLSDERQKERIEPLRNALSDILALRGVSFYWKPELNRNPSRQIGLVAQEVEKVLPELVRTDPEGLKSVDYISLTAVLAEAMQEQQATIEAQGAEIERLRHEAETAASDREMLLLLAARVSRLEAGE